MSVEQNKAIYRRLIDAALNNGDLALTEFLIDASYVRHDAPSFPLGPRGFNERVAAIRAAFPDVHYTLEDVIAEGDRVASRWTAHGTHSGTLFGLGAPRGHLGMGISPAGKLVMWRGIDFCRFADAKLIESWSLPDRLGLLQQLEAAAAEPVP